MNYPHRGYFISIFFSLFIWGSSAVWGVEEDVAARLDFFEKRIRPALVEHCLECHAVDTEISGGLLLDSAAGWQRGGDTGPVIERGTPETSLLVKAIEYQDPQLQMPPDGQLPESVVADFRNWIRDGAIDPRPELKPAQSATGLPLDRAQEHWAYRPITAPTIPRGGQAASSIDAFLERQQREAGLLPTPEASRASLLRRLKFDLHGLPPTPEELARFEADRSPDAYERWVDSLLASPLYAERMARRWLDVARYAESLTLRGFIFDNAWRFRDYCIESFAADRPFDEMLREQIAGDLMDSDDLEARRRQVVASSFWLLGNSNLEEQDKQQLEMDVIDEQLDTLGKALLGQTIGCARCHDHKFDPIPTRDYYALAGVLKSSQSLEHSNVSKWIEQPLPAKPEDRQRFEEISARVSKLTQEIDRQRKAINKLTKRSTPVVQPKDVPGIVVDDVQAKKIGNWQASTHTSVYVGDGYLHDQNEGKGSKTVSFEPLMLHPGNYEVRLAYAPGPNRATNAQVTVFSADGEANLTIDQRESPSIEGLWISLGRYRFEKDGQAFVIVSNENTDGHVVADAVQFLPDPMAKEKPSAKPLITEEENEATKRKLTDELRKMEATKKELEEVLHQQPKAMAMLPRKEAADLPIHIRGDVHNLGKVVPRGTLQLVRVSTLSELDRPFTRLELAEWITSPEQPLTARVMANRLWSWLMGEGLVRTVDNFGTTGEAPSHAELLDYLATRLRDEQWSIRRLVREILLSDAYRRSSASVTANEAIDPDNRLLWRAHRRRLDAESIRDSMLMISGQLAFDMYGRRLPEGIKADYGYAHDEPCRSIYVPALRNSTPDVFEAFDIADPSSVVGKRNRSTIASQALWMMNHPWVREQARQTAERLCQAYDYDGVQLIEQASMRILGRSLTRAERDSIPSLLSSIVDSCREPAASRESRIELCAILVQSLFQSIDFRFPE